MKYLCLMRKHNGMKPQDIVILLKIASLKGKPFAQKKIAAELYISESELSESLNRSVFAGLLMPDKRAIMSLGLIDFLKSGLRYVFPATPGKIIRGIPTAHSAPPLNGIILQGSDVYVWPSAKGDKRGQAIEPLYKSVPEIALRDNELYQLLALIDAMRVGKAREKSIGAELLEKKIKQYAVQQQ
jgi:hypothetical protein